MSNLKAVDNQLMAVHNKLGGLLKEKMDALPKDFNQTRFLQNCMTVLQDTRDIENADPSSIARTMLKGAFLGLDFFNKECYAICYGGSIQFQTDYKGEIKLAKKYSLNPIKDIYAKVVREGDVFEEEIINGHQTVNFKPKTFNDGEIIGAFAVCLFKDGSMIYETMTTKEIEATRDNYSKQKTGQAWTKSKGEMFKKTVLRRLCKLIELDFDNQEQLKAFEDGSEFEFKDAIEVKAKEVIDPFKEQVIAEGVIE